VNVAKMWIALIGQAGWKGAVCRNNMTTEPGQDPSHFQFTNSEDLGQPPVKTYESHFPTFLTFR
jgi:hypothetical protein